MESKKRYIARLLTWFTFICMISLPILLILGVFFMNLGLFKVILCDIIILSSCKFFFGEFITEYVEDEWIKFKH